jgi:hypothetical protein
VSTRACLPSAVPSHIRVAGPVGRATCRSGGLGWWPLQHCTASASRARLRVAQRLRRRVADLVLFMPRLLPAPVHRGGTFQCKRALGPRGAARGGACVLTGIAIGRPAARRRRATTTPPVDFLFDLDPTAIFLPRLPSHIPAPSPSSDLLSLLPSSSACSPVVPVQLAFTLLRAPASTSAGHPL